MRQNSLLKKRGFKIPGLLMPFDAVPKPLENTKYLILTELLDGDLEWFINEVRKRDSPDLDSMNGFKAAITLGNALNDFHQYFIHCDIKPANILLKVITKKQYIQLKRIKIHVLQLNGKYYQMKITDFGISIIIDRENECFSQTASFSPKVFRIDNYHIKWDMFSLAIVLINLELANFNLPSFSELRGIYLKSLPQEFISEAKENLIFIMIQGYYEEGRINEDGEICLDLVQNDKSFVDFIHDRYALFELITRNAILIFINEEIDKVTPENKKIKEILNLKIEWIEFLFNVITSPVNELISLIEFVEIAQAFLDQCEIIKSERSVKGEVNTSIGGDEEVRKLQTKNLSQLKNKTQKDLIQMVNLHNRLSLV
jgi:serine/threonine protein kinase